MSKGRLLKVLNTEYTRDKILNLMKFKTVIFENAGLLAYESFKIRPYQNSIDILASGSNDDHYMATVSGIGIGADATAVSAFSGQQYMRTTMRVCIVRDKQVNSTATNITWNDRKCRNGKRKRRKRKR